MKPIDENIPMTLMKGDIYYWTPTPFSTFFTKYVKIVIHVSTLTWWWGSKIWNLTLPPKISFFLWKMLHKKLPSDDDI